MGQDKRSPKSTYAAKYPYNRVEVTEAGHEIHYDDTPGKERIRHSHKSGTYREISADGKEVNMTVGSRVDYVKQGMTMTVDKNMDTKVSGSTRSSVTGSSHSEVKKSVTTAIGKDSKTTVGGDSVSAVKGDMVTGVIGKTTMKIGGGIAIKGDSTIDSKMDGGANLQFGDTVRFESKVKIELVVGSSMITIEDGKITLKADKIKTDGKTILDQERTDDGDLPRVVTEAGPARRVQAKV